MARRKRKSKSIIGPLFAVMLLPINVLLKALMAWDGFTTSNTRKRRKGKF